MEAKVDVRKLQLLNDRIMQTLEALNQVRVSVHGIGQTPYGAPSLQQGGLGHSGAPYGYGAIGPYAAPVGWPSPSQNYYNSPSAYYGQSALSHTPYGTPSISPWQQIPWQSPLAHSPYSPASLYGQPAYAPSPWAAQLTPMTGLMHSHPYEQFERQIAEQRASDPSRLMQHFPYGAYV